MVLKPRIEMSVGGVQKISLWKKEGSAWVECPNLPKSFLQSYLNRGFVTEPPKEKAEEPVPTFAEAVESGILTSEPPVVRKNKGGRPRGSRKV